MNSVALPVYTYSYRFNVGQIQKTLVPAGQSRYGIVIHNESNTLFVKLGPSVSSTDYTYKLTPGMTLEIAGWAAAITAVRDVGSGWVMCTETV